jgi:hypothetical protein
MKLDVEYILLAAAFLVWLDIIIVLRVLANKTSLALDEEGRQKGYADLASVFKVEKSKKRKIARRFFDLYLKLAQSIELPGEEREKLRPERGNPTGTSQAAEKDKKPHFI